mmetsp:Transcript_21196/g.71249  ORF Transcript_21196/g.71249 Transcript_21196/m.71249 type:complete len:252 (-) Transcript_21196:240-995(-)
MTGAAAASPGNGLPLSSELSICLPDRSGQERTTFLFTHPFPRDMSLPRAVRMLLSQIHRGQWTVGRKGRCAIVEAALAHAVTVKLVDTGECAHLTRRASDGFIVAGFGISADALCEAARTGARCDREFARATGGLDGPEHRDDDGPDPDGGRDAHPPTTFEDGLGAIEDAVRSLAAERAALKVRMEKVLVKGMVAGEGEDARSLVDRIFDGHVPIGEVLETVEDPRVGLRAELLSAVDRWAEGPGKRHRSD